MGGTGGEVEESTTVSPSGINDDIRLGTGGLNFRGGLSLSGEEMSSTRLVGIWGLPTGGRVSMGGGGGEKLGTDVICDISLAGGIGRGGLKGGNEVTGGGLNSRSGRGGGDEVTGGGLGSRGGRGGVDGGNEVTGGGLNSLGGRGGGDEVTGEGLNSRGGRGGGDEVTGGGLNSRGGRGGLKGGNEVTGGGVDTRGGGGEIEDTGEWIDSSGGGREGVNKGGGSVGIFVCTSTSIFAVNLSYILLVGVVVVVVVLLDLIAGIIS